MSEGSQTPETPEVSAPVALGADKRALAEKTLQELLALMELPGTMDFQDAADGGLSVALHLSTELPGAAVGKRSHVLDSLQFLVNKLVNRPGTERRWIAVGLGAHPAPRGPKLPRPPSPPAPAAPSPLTAAPAGTPSAPRAAAPLPPRAAAPVPARGPRGKGAGAPGMGRGGEGDERSLPVEVEPVLGAEVRKLAEVSARLGRFFAVLGMKPEERAQVLKATEGVPGLKLHIEGEGRSRRVVFTPDKPAPMPKRTLPVEDDEDEAL